MGKIDLIFTWFGVVLIAFLTGCILGPLGIGALDTTGALILLAGGVVGLAIFGPIALKLRK